MENPREDIPNRTLVKNGAFTVAAVQADDEVAGTVAAFELANSNLLSALRQQEDLELDVRKAEAKLDQADRGRKGLDKAIQRFELALLGLVDKNRKDPRYQRYLEDGLRDITEADIRMEQPKKTKRLLALMNEDMASSPDQELKDLLNAHAPVIQAALARVQSAETALGALEDALDMLEEVTLPGLRQAWTAERQALYAALLSKFPGDRGRVEAYFLAFSRARKTPKKAPPPAPPA